MRQVVMLLFLLGFSSAYAGGVTVSDRLAWLPADFAMMVFSSPDRAPILQFVPNTLRSKTPTCFAAELKTLDIHIQAQAAITDRATFLFHGKMDRQAIERCAKQVLEAIGSPVAVEAGANITSFSNAQTKSYVGWRKDWAIWSDDRELVESLLAANPRSKLNSRITEFLKLVEPCAEMCGAATIDMTSKLLGVPSLGFFFMTQLEGTVRLPVTFMFGSSADALRADEALKKAALDPQFSSGLRQLFGAVKGVIRDKSWTVDVAPTFSLPVTVIQEANETLRRLVHQPK